MAPFPDENLVSKLIARQFREFADQPVSRLDPGGWDNLSFRLGETMLVKIPRNQAYADQPQRENSALRALGDKLPLPIPRSIGLGIPSELYRNHWSILEWIEGDCVAHATVAACDLQNDLARFLRALHSTAPSDAPEPGTANFWRGGPLAQLNSDFETAVEKLASRMDMHPALAVWEEAIAREPSVRKCWVHGDIAPANLLQRDGTLCAAIDFGLASAGDPACDLAIAWFAFDSREREEFIQAYGSHDRDLLLRARAWALWKAVLVLADMSLQPPGYLPSHTIMETICQDNSLG